MMHENKGTTPLDVFPAVPLIEGHANNCSRRFTYYFASLFLGICAFSLPLKELIAMSLQSELYSHIPLMYSS